MLLCFTLPGAVLSDTAQLGHGRPCTNMPSSALRCQLCHDPPSLVLSYPAWPCTALHCPSCPCPVLLPCHVLSSLTGHVRNVAVGPSLDVRPACQGRYMIVNLVITYVISWMKTAVSWRPNLHDWLSHKSLLLPLPFINSHDAVGIVYAT